LPVTEPSPGGSWTTWGNGVTTIVNAVETDLSGKLVKTSNLSDLASASTARTNLGLAPIAASGSATDLSTGTVATARLGSGTANSTTFLRGDNIWSAPPSSVLWDIDPDSNNNVQRIRHSTQNFLTNASLEIWLNGTSVAPNGWTLGGDATVSRSTNATTGSFAAQIAFGTANTGEFYQDIGVSNLVDYTFSCYVERLSGTGAARLVAQQEGGSFTEYASVALDTTAGQRLAVLTVKPATSGLMRFSIKSGNGVISTWRVDECMAQESKAVATTFQPCFIDDDSTQVIYGHKTLIVPTIIDPLEQHDTNGITYAATVTPDASTGSRFSITATGALTLNPPTNQADGRPVVVEVLASGAGRTVTFGAGFQRATGVGTTLAVTSGKIGIFQMVYSSFAAAWIMTSATQTQ
jgi:hypothetical protein